MTEPVISVDRLVKRFGKQEALRGLSLSIAPGQTFAFLGPNGAGKTTTIRTLVGLLAPDAGDVRVLGLDPTIDPLEVRRRVGYLAEDQTMYGWMRVEEIIRFIAPFYPTWDHELARYLRNRDFMMEKCYDCPDQILCGGGCPLYSQHHAPAGESEPA